jgi:DNA repair protein SbcC/Rad50
MIPLQIKLRNFLSYGAYTQTISFEPYHLICLSGKNGHGKSALLDAMTWALWGQARKTLSTTKADEGLLRLGQTHMMVCFDFLCNDKKYRVQREFVTQQNRSHSDLYFGIASDKTNDTFISLTEKTSRLTQEKIITTIGLSYESCINSIFLRQGQSNEFSQKSAKERKEILATILGINQYETLRTKAQEKIRTLIASQEQLKNIIHNNTALLEQKKQIQEQLIVTEDAVATIRKQQETHQKDYDKLQHRTKQFQKHLQQQLVLKTRLKNCQELWSKQWNLLKENNTQLRTLRRHIIRTPFNSTEKEKFLALEQYYQQQRDELFAQKELLLTLQTEHAQQEQTLNTQYHEQLIQHAATAQKLEQEKDQLITQQKNLVAELIEKNKFLSNHHEELQKLQKISLEQVVQKQETLFERRKQHYHTWIDRGNRLNQQIQELQQKKILGQGVSSVTCPLCEQALSTTRKRFLIDKLIEQEHLASHQKKRLARLIPALKQLIINDHATLTSLKQKQERYEQITIVIRTLTEEIKIIHEKLHAVKKAILSTTQEYSHAAGKYAQFKKNKEQFFIDYQDFHERSQKLILLKKVIVEHPYDQEKHECNKIRLDQIKQQEEQQHLYVVYRAEYAQTKKNFLQICTEMKVLRKQLHTLLQELAPYDALAEEEQTIKKYTAELDEQQKLLTQKMLELMQKKSMLEQQLKTIVEREEEYTRYQQQLKKEEQELDDYQLIVQALGKNGIQALLIETAIPELEYEANLLLNKLTDNQAHIMIESVRDLKSGGFKETLDIKISDAVGTRPYELFSGGEAFRIDFALRIALSKLLARRSGTSLQTLIIDEGFGSQDEEGLSRIMEALYKVQDDFAKIIIVSHLPDMKNQFPTHFFVYKGSTGSQITVFEQG